MASRSEQINTALDQLLANNSTDVTGAAVISSDGMLLGSRMAAGVNADRVGAISATMMGVTTRVVNDLKIGQAQEAIIHADKGYLVVVPVNTQIVLAIILRPQANLGLIRLEARDTGQRVAAAMAA